MKYHYIDFDGLIMKKFMTTLMALFLLVSCGTNKPRKTENEKKADLYYSYGTSNLINKKYTDALNNLMKAATFSPDDSRIHNNLGMAYYFKKDTKSAIKHVKKAIDLDENNHDALVNLASIYYNLKRFKLAEKYYKEVQGRITYKFQYRVLYNLALLEFKKGDSLKTLSYLSDAIKENPDYCPAHYLEGRVFEAQRNFERAYESFKNSYQGPCYNNPAPHFKAGSMLAKTGKFLDARLKLNEVVERFPTSQYSAFSRNLLRNIKDKADRKAISNNKIRKFEEEVNKSYQATDF